MSRLSAAGTLTCTLALLFAAGCSLEDTPDAGTAGTNNSGTAGTGTGTAGSGTGRSARYRLVDALRSKVVFSQAAVYVASRSNRRHCPLSSGNGKVGNSSPTATGPVQTSMTSRSPAFTGR